jgi:BirA family biotin operon repressor/biotin-[acetyl-CoA-carboxylase] ligase
VESVEALGQDSLRRAVLAAGIDAEPRWLDETGSTSSDLLELADGGAPEWTLVATGHQTAGRGRLGRSWADVPGSSLLVSVLLRPRLEPDRAPLLTLLAAVAMAEASGLPEMRSKWPNDLVVGERKAGGILAEASVADAAVRHVVIGTGVNLLTPEVPDGSATSILEEGGDPDAEGILTRYLLALRGEYERDGFPGGVVARYAAICSSLGRRVRAEQAGGSSVEGVATGLDERGGLLMETADGTRTMSFGEVIHLRTA